MALRASYNQWFAHAKSNIWYRYFSILCRFALAAGFIPAGFVKLFGERFASGLSIAHPMGAYLEALHHTGYYYTFIGVIQILAAILLLIPRTVIIGALLYLPIILNITVLTYAVRFDGSLFTAPLMTLATLYILVWHSDRLHYLLLSKTRLEYFTPLKKSSLSHRFPWLFFGVIFLIFIGVLGVSTILFDVMPRNTQSDCLRQFEKNDMAGKRFCGCIHDKATDLNTCLDAYYLEKGP